jgi:hypothetical protein
MNKLLFIISIAAFALSSCSSPINPSPISPGPDSAVIKTATAAFIYSMPLALMDITRQKGTNYEMPVDGKGAPINQFMISTQFPDAKFRLVVRPNADTYYNAAMLDLSIDAMVLNLPNTNGRYYLMPMLSAYTNVFASPGKRTTGTAAGTFLITGPKWTGKVPDNMKEIKSPTNLVWILGRIQTNSAADGKNIVVPIERKVKLTPLSTYGKPYTAPKGKVDPNLNASTPNLQLENMPIDVYFNNINQLMVGNPPASADAPAIAEFAKIGIGPGATFNLSAYDTITQRALKNIPKKVTDDINEMVSKGLVKPVNGWSIAFKNFANFGQDYQLRAVVAYLGLGANLPEDAIYPSCTVDSSGNLLDGSNKYVIHFEKGQTPPVNAFWSLTMYDNDGFFIPNPINLYAIGDRNKLKSNPDGSIDIYFQVTSPGKDKENNWLPCPKGSFNLMLRMYWPKDAVLNGSWTPPPVKRLN